MPITFRHGVFALISGTVFASCVVFAGQDAAAQSSSDRNARAARFASKLRFGMDASKRVAAAAALVKMGFFDPAESEIIRDVARQAVVTEVRDGHVIALGFPGHTACNDSDLRTLARFAKLERLWMIYSSKCEATTAEFPLLTSLKDLTICSMPISDRDLKRLGNMSQLTKLDLRGTFHSQSEPITSAGLVHLKDMRQLTELTIINSHIDDTGLEHLTNLTQLRSLCLSHSLVTGRELTNQQQHLPEKISTLLLSYSRVDREGVVAIARLKQLTRLFLRHNPEITDDTLKHLAPLKQLEELYLDHTGITDAGLPHLRALPRLRYLGLDGNKISDAGLEHLHEFKDLQNVQLNSSRATLAGMKRLQAAHGGRLNISSPLLAGRRPAPSKRE